MKIGLFLDVDKTLTKNFIQQEYAKLLDCEGEYLNVEKEFQDGKISSLEFGKKIISIFKNKKFTQNFAIEKFDNIELNDWTDKLLKMDVDIYLVSSGPSYYIDTLAKKYGIHKDCICRSEYNFNEKDGIIQSCQAINVQQKSNFVKDKVSKYDISIGIGDHPEFDGPFISLCTIPILTCKRDGYLYTPSFSTAMSLVDKLLKSNKKVEAIDIPSITVKNILTLMKHLTLKSVGIIMGICLFLIILGMLIDQFILN